MFRRRRVTKESRTQVEKGRGGRKEVGYSYGHRREGEREGERVRERGVREREREGGRERERDGLQTWTQKREGG